MKVRNIALLLGGVGLICTGVVGKVKSAEPTPNEHVQQLEERDSLEARLSTSAPKNCRWETNTNGGSTLAAYCDSGRTVLGGACAANTGELLASYPFEWGKASASELNNNLPEGREHWDNLSGRTGWQCKTKGGGNNTQAWALCCRESDTAHAPRTSRDSVENDRSIETDGSFESNSADKVESDEQVSQSTSVESEKRSARKPNTVKIDNCRWQIGGLSSTDGLNLSGRLAAASCGRSLQVVTGGCYQSGNLFSLDHSAPYEASRPVRNHIESGDDWDDLARASGWYCAWSTIDPAQKYYAWAMCCGG